jgi:hypothetical protein
VAHRLLNLCVRQRGDFFRPNPEGSATSTMSAAQRRGSASSPLVVEFAATARIFARRFRRAGQPQIRSNSPTQRIQPRSERIAAAIARGEELDGLTDAIGSDFLV